MRKLTAIMTMNESMKHAVYVCVCVCATCVVAAYAAEYIGAIYPMQLASSSSSSLSSVHPFGLT